MDGSRLAKMRVSCLKIEPKVSIFPVIEAKGFYYVYYYGKSFQFSFSILLNVIYVRGVEDLKL